MRRAWNPVLRHLLLVTILFALLSAVLLCTGCKKQIGVGDPPEPLINLNIVTTTTVWAQTGDVTTTTTPVPVTTTTTHEVIEHPVDEMVVDHAFNPQGPVPADLPSKTGDPGTDMMTNVQWALNGNTPAETRAKLVQNGDKFMEDFEAIAGLPFAQSLWADVTGCGWTEGEAVGEVTCDLYYDGEKFYSVQDGQTMREVDIWKLSEQDWLKVKTALEGIGLL